MQWCKQTLILASFTTTRVVLSCHTYFDGKVSASDKGDVVEFPPR